MVTEELDANEPRAASITSQRELQRKHKEQAQQISRLEREPGHKKKALTEAETLWVLSTALNLQQEEDLARQQRILNQSESRSIPNRVANLCSATLTRHDAGLSSLPESATLCIAMASPTWIGRTSTPTAKLRS
jgi:hypothetical protein